MRSAATSIAQHRRERVAFGLVFLLALLIVAIPASAGTTLAVATLSPSNGQTVSGSITWQVAVPSGNVGRVDFAIDGNVKWTEHVAPWVYNGVAGGLNTAALADGTHSLTARAYSKNGKSTGSSTVTVTVANAAPAPPPPPPPPPPTSWAPSVSTTLPSISGTPTVGQTLTASTGTWSGSTPMTYTHSWARCNTSGGSCTPISGATSASYVLVSADAGFTIRVSVTATNSAGSAMATSAATPVIATAPAPPPPSAPSPSLGTALPPRMPLSSNLNAKPGDPGTIVVPAGGSVSTALSNASSGTVIYLHGGSYGQQIIQNRDFSSSNPVTIRNYPGETVNLVGRSSGTSAGNAFYLGGSSGIRIQAVPRAAIIYNTPYDNAIKVEASQNIELDGVVIKNAGKNNVGSGLLVGPGSFTPSYTSDLQVWNSFLHDNGGVGGTGYDHQLYISAQHSVFANNVIHDGPTGCNFQAGPSLEDSIITNNTIVHDYEPNQASANMVIWNGGGTSGTNNLLVVNNIIAYALHSGVIASGSGGGATTNIVRSNLFYSNPSGDWNEFYGSTRVYTAQAPNYKGDPLFSDYAGRNFTLQAASPARGKAEPAYTPPFDAAGNPRSSTPALGAYG